MAETGQPTSLGFLLFPGFPMACLTSAIEPLRAANEIVGRREFAWRLLAEEAGPVRSSAEVKFDPDATLAEAEGLDCLFFLSMPQSNFAHPKRSNAQVRRMDRSGVVLGGFSGGIFPLVRSGVMGGHVCSVHWCYEAAFKAEFPDIAASQSVIIRDRRRHTASGAGAVFDLMLRMIEEKLGRDTMTEVACWFQHPFVRADDASQKVPVQKRGGTDDMLPDAIRQAIQVFSDHIEDPVQISDVASALGMSERHLERSFKQATGQSPLKYYRLMRLKKARQKVLYSTQSITEIALSVGYASSTPMTRHYAEAFGVNPADERRRLVGLRGLAGALPPSE
ncbi:GlxA family transcriptional regulator [Paragemmobacter ruber]|uniref:Helix-turn-helix domain-containing protein n=1 Tax=Paragemmobacter ruber TaxID=1985673 RepID=A0ABW9Y0T8_9RHOB|nr:GlxA family transcriptional regulator [Rhodobacter ruber]NBE06105.1 helix-turn-helix domain-containing protein [Rhodobacter ruber]